MNSLPPQIRRKFHFAVYKVCGRHTLVPQSLEIPLCYNPNEKSACHGGFADVWKGRYRGKEVAAKVLRPRPTDDLERVRRVGRGRYPLDLLYPLTSDHVWQNFCKEVVGWKTLHHPNVLPLLGVTTTDNRLVMVSEWMTNGNITEFLKVNPNVDRLELVRFFFPFKVLVPCLWLSLTITCLL